MPTYLFVYGTLMRPFESSMRRFLEENSYFAGEGTVPGRLYDLGRYPGLVIDPHSEGQVKGHIFELRNVQKVLNVLDKYEGIDPAAPAKGEYRRIQFEVRSDAEPIPCWIYEYNHDPAGLPLIPAGDYPAYAKSNVAHQRFIRSA